MFQKIKNTSIIHSIRHDGKLSGDGAVDGMGEHDGELWGTEIRGEVGGVFATSSRASIEWCFNNLTCQKYE